MERNFKNRDFEEFIKENADQYRMFPSEKVWAGIDNALHKRRRWYGLTLGLLLLLTGAGVTWVMITTPVKEVQSKAIVPAAPVTSKDNIEGRTAPVSKVPFVASAEKVLPARKASPIEFILTGTSNTLESGDITNETGIENNFASTDLLITNGKSSITLLQKQVNKSASTPVIIPTSKLPALKTYTQSPVIAKVVPVSNPAEEAEPKTAAAAGNNHKTYLENTFIPWTIESVVNSFKQSDIKKKVEWQLYLSPTVSYRRLSENKAFLRNAAAIGSVPNYAAYLVDVKSVVTHKPDMGLELGMAAKYPVSRNLRLKAGLQFNVSRYDIRAFSSPTEPAVIALDAGFGSTSITRQSTYRTRNGNNENWLQNLYYSASIPMGIEFRASQNKKTNFSIVSTIQPTYVISDKAYLISTDYKNYIEVPKKILRRLNYNAGFEALIGFSSGNYNWQVGPRVRYQLLSSFKDLYPVKENLFDFGLKIGVGLKN